MRLPEILSELLDQAFTGQQLMMANYDQSNPQSLRRLLCAWGAKLHALPPPVMRPLFNAAKGELRSSGVARDHADSRRSMTR